MILAIDHAHTVLSWYENLPSEEIPPNWMWPFDQELEAWFRRVDEERKAKHSGGGSSSSDPELDVQNEFAKGRGRG